MFEVPRYSETTPGVYRNACATEVTAWSSIWSAETTEIEAGVSLSGVLVLVPAVERCTA